MGIDAQFNMGEPVFKSSWGECRTYCNVDKDCKAFSFNPNGNCQKKTKLEYRTQTGFVSGPKSTPPGADTNQVADSSSSSSETTPTTTPTPTPAPATTAPVEEKKTDWWMDKSPLGVEWWIVILVAILLLGFSCVGMVMMMSMSGE